MEAGGPARSSVQRGFHSVPAATVDQCIQRRVELQCTQQIQYLHSNYSVVRVIIASHFVVVGHIHLVLLAFHQLLHYLRDSEARRLLITRPSHRGNIV